MDIYFFDQSERAKSHTHLFGLTNGLVWFQTLGGVCTYINSKLGHSVIEMTSINFQALLINKLSSFVTHF